MNAIEVWRPQPGNVYQFDALSFLRQMESGSVDAIITDLPYGTTACSWDEIIPFAPMWAAVKRVLKPRGVFVTTASQPFTSALIMSNPAWFKCEWIWEKTTAANFKTLKNYPAKKHENIIVFAESTPIYIPQMRKGAPYIDSRITKRKDMSIHGSHQIKRIPIINNGERYPDSVIRFDSGNNFLEHPTQKPVKLYEYLIRTYTQPGDLVVDPCCGSGTTCVAARNLKRRWLGCDTSAEYVEIARDRLRSPEDKPRWMQDEGDVATLPVREGYDRTLFASARAAGE